MTLVSDIITRAYRETNLIPLVSSPSTAEQNEGLALLNSAILACVGMEAGEELSDLNIGGAFDDSSAASTNVPVNQRLILNLTSAKTLKLDPYPYEGQRLAVADASSNLSTYNLTLDGNGRTIEGSATLALSTDGLTRQWFYRSDTADWVKITSLATTDSMPFPEEFDDYFIIRLAMRLNPRNGRQLAQESAAMLQRSEQAIEARYRRPRPVQDMGTLGLLGSRCRAFGPSTGEFNAGRPRF